MNQPNALRLANELIDLWDSGFFEREDVEQAAAELRRLHEANQELIEAAKRLIGSLSVMIGDPDNCGDIQFAKAAIARGEQQ